MESSWLLIFLTFLLLYVIFVLIYLHLSKSPQRAMEPSMGRELVPVMEKTAETEAGQDSEKKRPKELNADLSCARFIDTFPAKREKIEQCVSCLQEMANYIDETHKNCTIANVAANVTGASSEILKIVSQLLAPSSAAGSLGVAITGIGLEMAAKITDISTNTFKSAYSAKKKEEAEDLLKKSEMTLRTLMNSEEMDFSSELPRDIKAIGGNLNPALAISGVCQAGKGFGANIKALDAHIKALKCVQANPKLKDLAMKVAAANSKQREGIKELNDIECNFAGTPLGLTKEARLQNAEWSVCVLFGSIKSTVESAAHLTEGAEAEMAVNIRSKANQLAKILQKLKRLYEELKVEDCSIRLKSM